MKKNKDGYYPRENDFYAVFHANTKLRSTCLNGLLIMDYCNIRLI